jgi:FkbM family methyltransferase
MPLNRAKGYWLTGDWRALADMGELELANHPERDRLALLLACAHQQCGSHERAGALVRQALNWGCKPSLAARLLLSGLHNTFGRIAALRRDDERLQMHFRQALEVAGDRDGGAAAHGRAVREMASLGLLPQAAGLLQREVEAASEARGRPALAAARVQMLRSEVELLQHELSLAQQRGLRTLPAVGGSVDAPAEKEVTRLQRLSTSQLGQDLWVLERTEYKRGGYFVEFGATDGVRLSNTYLLETEFDWRGLCVEPNPKLFARLRENRRCKVGNACVGARTGDVVEFVLAEEYGGMVKDIANDMHAAKREAYLADADNRATLSTVSLNDLLVQFDAPKDIDYLSIDTEGSEYEILAAFPFERWNVRLLSVEHNFTEARERLRVLLESQGYRRVEARWDDWYWKED